MLVPQLEPVELLILGAGWTSTFLIPLLEKEGVSYAATTTTGRDGTIPFKFDSDPDSDDDTAPFQRLPAARTVLITFPLKGTGPSAKLVRLYAATHPSTSSPATAAHPQYVQLGATSIWTAPTWQDSSSPYDRSNARAIAEDELISVAGGCALDLAGLYGGARQPRTWVDRVIRTKADLRGKGALHLIHGEDVARAILGLHRRFTPATRWLLCDLHAYDWWDLAQDWAVQALREQRVAKELAAASGGNAAAGASGSGGGGGGGGGNEGEKGAAAGVVVYDEAVVARQNELQTWVGELMLEEGVKALPRDSELLGRRLDGRGFWKHVGIWPSHGRVR